MVAILNYKLSLPAVVRKTALEGHRFTPTELLSLGVVDELVDNPSKTDSLAIVEAARRFAESKAELAKTGVLGLMKRDLMRTIFEAAKLDNRLVHPRDQRRMFTQQGVSSRL